MYPTLSDLRILKLVLAVEDAFEAYEEALLDLIEDEETRNRLKVHLGNGPSHERLEQEHDRLQVATFRNGEPLDPKEVLQVILECERSARDLYLRYLDRVQDPRIVELLRGLAQEEESHAEHVLNAFSA